MIHQDSFLPSLSEEFERGVGYRERDRDMVIDSIRVLRVLRRQEFERPVNKSLKIQQTTR